MFEKLRKTQFNFVFFGISAAMPSFALGIPFGLWLLSAGVTKQTLGLVTVSSIIVAFNFLWSPFVNKIKLPILYGGSANEKNCAEIMSINDVGGLLVGGASLKAREFMEISQT